MGAHVHHLHDADPNGATRPCGGYRRKNNRNRNEHGEHGAIQVQRGITS